VIHIEAQSSNTYTVGQFFAEFAAQWTLIAAAIAITASPLVLLYLFTQRYIIAGMTSGALKG